MNTAEWILVAILSITLFVFLVVGIILVIKCIELVNGAKKIVETGQSVANKADDIVSRAATFSTVSGAASTFSNVIGLVKTIVDKNDKEKKKEKGKESNSKE